MYYYHVAPTRIVRKDTDSFTYSSQEEIAIGCVVTIPIAKTQSIGIVLSATSKPSFDTKSIVALIETAPLPQALLDTARWMSEYYATPLATVLSGILPRGLTTKRRSTLEAASRAPIRQRNDAALTDDQQKAVDIFLSDTHPTKLLFGVTGSGKTRVYIEVAKRLFAQGKSSTILVPEIALTSQIIDEFRHEFGDTVIVAHSRQSEAHRHQVWQKVLHSRTPLIIVGARSALFLPVKNLGLIVLDEVHEPSYKQEQSPRYSALRVATILAKHHQASAVFGSATPPISEYYLATKHHAPIVRLPQPAQTVQKPHTTLVDMTKRNNFTSHRFLSNPLLAAMRDTLESGKQVLLFHNRRGTASTTLCTHCGWIAIDPDTDIPLTLHADHHTLISHITGYTMPVPTSCPVCYAVDIIHKGIGTKLLESEIRRLFANKKVVRFDGDSGDDHSVERRYEELYDGSIDIIIGTQVIAKGIDLPHLRTVGVIQADAGLSLPDYTSDERTFQLLAQVVGRVGRSNAATQVVVQTYQPDHLAITNGLQQNYSAFYDATIAKRKAENFPPFCYLIQFTCTYKTEAAAVKNARLLLAVLRQHASQDVQILGPAPAFYEKQHGTYRWQLIAKSPTRAHLKSLVTHLPAKYWQYELDPVSLI